MELPSQQQSDQDAQTDLKKKQEKFQQDPNSYNGAIRENYTWTQTIKDIDVRVKIGSNAKTSKDVKVKIEKQSLSVYERDEKNEFKQIVSDNLAWKVKPGECTWSLFPKDHVFINLEKAEERWWENLLEKEEKLDLRNMNPEKPMEDLDEESQVKIKQMMYDQRQKQMGLPTSEEQRNLEMLQKAWNAEGSPFKGTPFDPSVLQKNNNNF